MIPVMKFKNKGEKSNKCNQCNYASSHVGNLRGHMKAHSGEKQMQQMWLRILWKTQFEETFENTQWRKVQQMQPM